MMPTEKLSRKLLPTICILLIFLTGCGTAAGTRPAEITVFAAASLTDAFDDLAEAFEAANPDLRVRLHFAASSQLAAQLAEGIPADVFASANPDQMAAVIERGRVRPGAAVPFAANRLAVITPADNPAAIDALEDLARPGVQLILAAEGVPIRTYTDDLVSHLPADFQAGFYANLVSEEDNVRRAAAKVALGEADAAIVYASDVTADIAGRLRAIPIPESLNVAAVYPIAPLVDAPNPEGAGRFIDFVLGPEGMRILAGRGFGPPPGEDQHA